MKEEETVCYICGKEIQEFDIVDPETGEQVETEYACPDEWKESHDRAKT